MLIFIVGAVSAADLNDTDVLENSSVEDVVGQELVSEPLADSGDTNKTQDASFSKVSRKNYITGNSFSVSLLDEKGAGIANKSVYFTVGNKVSKVLTNEKGVANLLLDFKKGTYTVKYNFNETGYKPISDSKDILLLSKPTSTIKGYTVKVYAGIKYKYKVTLKADGIPLQNRNVKFIFNKKSYIKKTDSKGVAVFTIYIAKGKYTISYSYSGEDNIKASKASSKVTSNLRKNPYGTRRTVIIDADGGFTKAFLNSVASKLRKAGWKVIVKGIGPGQHSINYKLAKNCVYMPFYNGMCAATIKEMTYSYYGGVIKRNKAVLAPAWYTKEWTNPKGMLPYRYDITKMKFLKRAWDDNFSPSNFKGISYPAKFMTSHGIKYCVGDTSYMIVEQFLYGGWVAHH